MTSTAFDLVQVLVGLFFIFLDNSSVTISCWDMKRLALLASSIQTNFFFGELNQSFARLAVIPTITVSGREMIFFSLEVLMVLGFCVLQWSIIIKIVHVAFSDQ